MPPIIGSILSIISSVVGGITDQQKTKLELVLQQDAEFNKLLLEQSKIDDTEAASPSLFVSGWRPAIGWICASAFAWVFVIQPVVAFTATIIGHPILLPSFDTSTLISLTMGMLGLGTLRTYEKVNKAD